MLDAIDAIAQQLNVNDTVAVKKFADRLHEYVSSVQWTANHLVNTLSSWFTQKFNQTIDALFSKIPALQNHYSLALDISTPDIARYAPENIVLSVEKFMDNERTMSIDPAEVLNNAQLPNSHRKEAGETLLWRQLNAKEEQGILAVHNMFPWKWVFELTTIEGWKKVKELIDTYWFSKKEAQLLCDYWICWRAWNWIKRRKINWYQFKDTVLKMVPFLNHSRWAYKPYAYITKKQKWAFNVRKGLFDIVEKQWWFVDTEWNIKLSVEEFKKIIVDVEKVLIEWESPSAAQELLVEILDPLWCWNQKIYDAIIYALKKPLHNRFKQLDKDAKNMEASHYAIYKRFRKKILRKQNLDIRLTNKEIIAIKENHITLDEIWTAIKTKNESVILEKTNKLRQVFKNHPHKKQILATIFSDNQLWGEVTRLDNYKHLKAIDWALSWKQRVSNRYFNNRKILFTIRAGIWIPTWLWLMHISDIIDRSILMATGEAGLTVQNTLLNNMDKFKWLKDVADWKMEQLNMWAEDLKQLVETIDAYGNGQFELFGLKSSTIKELVDKHWDGAYSKILELANKWSEWIIWIQDLATSLQNDIESLKLWLNDLMPHLETLAAQNQNLMEFISLLSTVWWYAAMWSVLYMGTKLLMTYHTTETNSQQIKNLAAICMTIGISLTMLWMRAKKEYVEPRVLDNMIDQSPVSKKTWEFYSNNYNKQAVPFKKKYRKWMTSAIACHTAYLETWPGFWSALWIDLEIDPETWKENIEKLYYDISLFWNEFLTTTTAEDFETAIEDGIIWISLPHKEQIKKSSRLRSTLNIMNYYMEKNKEQ